MQSGPTYYDFFGVRQNASVEQIRAAYLWLMKQHHPDLNDQVDRQRAADFAAIVNRSYDVLKDPLKRARYDAWLERGAVQPGSKKVRRALLTGETRRRREKTWDRSTKVAAALAAAIVLVIAGAVWIPGALPFAQSQSAAASVDVTQSSAGPSGADVRSEVRLAMSATAEEAELASGHCFDSARDQESLARIEACIIYDDAYLEWNRATNDGLSGSTYFNDSVVRLRQRDALAAIGSFQDARLDQLRQTALNAMLAQVKAEVNTSASFRSAAQNVDIRHKMSQ